MTKYFTLEVPGITKTQLNNSKVKMKKKTQ